MPHRDPIARRTYARAAARRKRERANVERRKREDLALANRPALPDVERAWAAGLFEGEGTVSITRGGTAGYSRSLVSVTNTDAEVIDFFQVRWPGSIRTIRPKSPRAREAQCWALYGSRVLPFLLDILPYVRRSAVRAKCELVIESQRMRRRGSRAPDYAPTLETFRDRIRVLNQRGRPLALPAHEA